MLVLTAEKVCCHVGEHPGEGVVAGLGPEVDLPANRVALHVHLGEHVRRRRPKCGHHRAVRGRRRRHILLAAGSGMRRCRRRAFGSVRGGSSRLGYLHGGDDVAPGGVHRRPADGRRRCGHTVITVDMIDRGAKSIVNRQSSEETFSSSKIMKIRLLNRKKREKEAHDEAITCMATNKAQLFNY